MFEILLANNFKSMAVPIPYPDDIFQKQKPLQGTTIEIGKQVIIFKNLTKTVEILVTSSF